MLKRIMSRYSLAWLHFWCWLACVAGRWVTAPRNARALWDFVLCKLPTRTIGQRVMKTDACLKFAFAVLQKRVGWGQRGTQARRKAILPAPKPIVCPAHQGGRQIICPVARLSLRLLDQLRFSLVFTAEWSRERVRRQKRQTLFFRQGLGSSLP